MKKECLSIVLLALSQLVVAQTNTFPATGNVGVGTATPNRGLEIFKDGGAHAVDSYLRLSTGTAGAYGGRSIIESTYNDYGNIAVDMKTTKITMAADVLTTTNVGGFIAFYTKPLDGAVGDEPTEKMRVLANGNVGIGTSTPGEKLAVNGKIRAKEIRVEAANWPDYVFDHTYQMPSLSEIENYIRINKHLPGIPTAIEVEKNGIELGEMNKILLKKVEELTVILIQKDKKMLEESERLRKVEEKLQMISLQLDGKH